MATLHAERVAGGRRTLTVTVTLALALPLTLTLTVTVTLALALALTVALALALTLTPGARLARLLVLAQREPQRQRALPRLQWPGTLAHGDGGLGVGRRQG